MSDAHARLGASNSHIWLTCLAAPGLWEIAPARPSSFQAREGTLAHSLAERALLAPDQALPEPGGTYNVEGHQVPVDAEMLSCVAAYADYTRQLDDMADVSGVEWKISLDRLWGKGRAPEHLFGTSDFWCVIGDTLHVCDLKYGKGHDVAVKFNSQLAYYAAGVFLTLEETRPDLTERIHNVSLTIIQPRTTKHPKVWTTSLGDLLYWAYGTVKPTVEAINDDALPKDTVPGRHCFFCPAKTICPETKRQSLNQARDFPDDL